MIPLSRVEVLGDVRYSDLHVGDYYRTAPGEVRIVWPTFRTEDARITIDRIYVVDRPKPDAVVKALLIRGLQ